MRNYYWKIRLIASSLAARFWSITFFNAMLKAITIPTLIIG